MTGYAKKNIILSFTVNRRKTSDEMALFAAISKVAVAASSSFLTPQFLEWLIHQDTFQ